MKIPELLAPVGSKEHLKLAILSGASSVYLSGENYGARKYAENFSLEEIEEAVKFAHLYNVKVYVTVNILIKERELAKVSEYLLELYKIGIDAVLVQDIGLVKILNELIPKLPIHGSTQMNIENIEGIKWAEKHNIKRIVLPREIKLNELKEMVKYAHSRDIEIEIFAHGAQCYSYSGRCLFSSMQGGRSGNRGTCAQPCREKYELIQSNEETNFINSKNSKTIKPKNEGDYLLSPKDLSLFENLDELVAIGIDSLKIEGRMRNTDYVATVISNYRQSLNKLRNKSKSQVNTIKSIEKHTEDRRRRYKDEEKTFKNLRNKQRQENKEELEELSLVFNREFSTGHLIPKDNPQIMNRNKPGHNGLYIGNIHRFNEQTNEIHIELRDDLITIPEKGDGLLIEGNKKFDKHLEDSENKRKNNKNRNRNNKNKSSKAPGHLEQKSENTYGLDISSKPILRDPKDKYWRKREKDRDVKHRILIVKKVRENKKINIDLDSDSKVYLTKRNQIINKTKDLLNENKKQSFRKSVLELYFRIDSENYPHLKGNLKLANGKVITLSQKGEDPWEEAIKKPISNETIKKQLSKIGNLPYYLDKITINNNKRLFCPISKINEFRRKFLDNLEKEIINSYKAKEEDIKLAENNIEKFIEEKSKKTKLSEEQISQAKNNQELAIYINNLNNLREINNFNKINEDSIIFNKIYLEIPSKETNLRNISKNNDNKINLDDKNKLDISYCVNFLKEAINISQKQNTQEKYELIWKLPDVINDYLKEDLIKILGILNKMDLKINVMNGLIGMEEQLKDKFGLEVYGNYPLNVFNSETILELKKYNRLSISPELYKKNIENILENYYRNTKTESELELLVHGNITALESRKDIISKKQLKTINQLNKKDKKNKKQEYYYLKNKKEQYYPLKSNILEEGVIMLNSEDFCLINYIEYLKSIAISKFSIDCRWKSANYIKYIGTIYKKAIKNQIDSKLANEIINKHSPKTSEGNFNKGIK